MGISFVSRAGTIREDTAIGIFFAAALALGVVLISTMSTYAVDLAHVLFGNVLGVTASDLWVSGGLALAILVSIVLLYRRLLVMSFDPILGETLGLSTHGLRTGLFLMIAATIVVALRTVGVALVTAMLVTPPAAAYLLTRRLPVMMAVSALDRRDVGGRRALRELLPGRGAQRGHGARGYCHLRTGVPVRPGQRLALEVQARAATRGLRPGGAT